MIRVIQYFSTELKTKIDVIPRGCFNSKPGDRHVIHTMQVLKIISVTFIPLLQNVNQTCKN